MTPPPRDPRPADRPRVAPGRVATKPRPPARRPAPARRVPASHGRSGLPPRPRARRVSRRGSPERRLRLGLCLVLLLMAVISSRLVQLQGFEGTAYRDAASSARASTTTLPAMRGTITDRNGQTLAITVEAREVFADPQMVQKDAKHDRAQTAATLSRLIGVPVADILDKFAKTNRFQVLARGLTPAQGDAVTAAMKDVGGIGVLRDTKRVYPAGDLAANVVGFVQSDDGKGLAGFEWAYDDLLKGKPGQQTGEVGAAGTSAAGTTIPVANRTLVPAVPGTGLQLTIDRDIQWHAQQILADQVRATGARSGTVTVWDVATGQLLALAVAPTFDPNDAGAADPSALGNPAVQSVYEPGSVSKVITMAAALQAGVVTPLTPFTVPDHIDVLGHTFHDAEVHGDEQLTVAGILAKSSNVGTIKVAEKVGADRLYAAMRAFGFGSKTGIGFPGEAPGVLPPVSQWSDSTLPTVAFGQGVSATALQVASVYATIANNGVRLTPSLVMGQIAPDGSVTPSASSPGVAVVTPEIAAQVRRMLESVTSEQGTAPAARIPGYRVAGKTGTAQRPDGHGGYAGFVASFVGFAPADNPQLLVSVVLDDPIRGHFGGKVAAPVFKQVMEFALQTRRIPPTGTTPEPYPLLAAVRR